MSAIPYYYSKPIENKIFEMNKLWFGKKFVGGLVNPVCLVCQCGCAARPATGVDRCHQSTPLSTNTQQNNQGKDIKHRSLFGKASQVHLADEPIPQTERGIQPRSGQDALKLGVPNGV